MAGYLGNSLFFGRLRKSFYPVWDWGFYLKKVNSNFKEKLTIRFVLNIYLCSEMKRANHIKYFFSFFLLAVFFIKIAGFHGFTHLLDHSVAAQTCSICGDFSIQQHIPFTPGESFSIEKPILSPVQRKTQLPYFLFRYSKTITNFYNKPPPFLA